MRLPRPWRGTPADPSRQGRGRPPPLAGRVRPNSERVPHGFASLTGQTRPARGGGRVLRRIFVGSLSCPYPARSLIKLQTTEMHNLCPCPVD